MMYLNISLILCTVSPFLALPVISPCLYTVNRTGGGIILLLILVYCLETNTLHSNLLLNSYNKEISRFIIWSLNIFQILRVPESQSTGNKRPIGYIAHPRSNSKG